MRTFVLYDKPYYPGGSHRESCGPPDFYIAINVEIIFDPADEQPGLLSSLRKSTRYVYLRITTTIGKLEDFYFLFLFVYRIQKKALGSRRGSRNPSLIVARRSYTTLPYPNTPRCRDTRLLPYYYCIRIIRIILCGFYY